MPYVTILKNFEERNNQVTEGQLTVFIRGI